MFGGGFILQNSNNQKVKNVLASASHEKLALSVSLSKKTSRLELVLDDRIVIKGIQTDRIGTNWKFISKKLLSNNSYKLRLMSEGEGIYKSWNLKTFPSPDAKVENVSIMSFTCAGGPEGFKISGKEFFKPFRFRQKVFDEGLSMRPDFAISIGDHIYWDLRGQNAPQIGRRNKLIKFFLGSYIGLVYGSFNRSEKANSSKNEKVLYDLFELAADEESRLVLIGIANGLDLLQRVLPNLPKTKKPKNNRTQNTKIPKTPKPSFWKMESSNLRFRHETKLEYEVWTPNRART